MCSTCDTANVINMTSTYLSLSKVSKQANSAISHLLRKIEGAWSNLMDSYAMFPKKVTGQNHN